MKTSMFATTSAKIVCLVLVANPPCVGCQNHDSKVDKKSPPKSERMVIAPEIIASYEKLGAEYGGFIYHPGVVAFHKGNRAAMQGMPAFKFDSSSKPELIKLPPVPIPFGLDLSLTGVTDKEIKQLKNLSNLAMLDLSATTVTDEGLRELKELKSLTYLDLGHTEVTDRGLKELKSLT